MDNDRYPDLGPRRTLPTFEACLPAVRALYPDASLHGSTGFERCYTIERDGCRLLVAHHWSPRSRGDKFHLRIRDPQHEPVEWV